MQQATKMHACFCKPSASHFMASSTTKLDYIISVQNCIMSLMPHIVQCVFAKLSFIYLLSFALHGRELNSFRVLCLPIRQCIVFAQFQTRTIPIWRTSIYRARRLPDYTQRIYETFTASDIIPILIVALVRQMAARFSRTVYRTRQASSKPSVVRKHSKHIAEKCSRA
jgi:hypothetical protein